ncbi:hypothetical protein Scep_009872 [Stephania cephalantha]|uniref:Uncharacterized protein n=1 Tax=Stephania cephalantha TaxID=152367 RepID=A0AAP0JUE0_9MAGN
MIVLLIFHGDKPKRSLIPSYLIIFNEIDRMSRLPQQDMRSWTYMVTSTHETWFGVRCVNTSKPAAKGAIVMQTAAFILVALYDGLIGVASRAMETIDQLA